VDQFLEASNKALFNFLLSLRLVFSFLARTQSFFFRRVPELGMKNGRKDGKEGGREGK
jgi:hypothetical protein